MDVPPPLLLLVDEVGCEPGIVVKSVFGRFAVLIVAVVGHDAGKAEHSGGFHLAGRMAEKIGRFLWIIEISMPPLP